MGGVVALDASGVLHHVTGPAALLFAELDAISPEDQAHHDHDALVALVDAGLVEAADAA
jgi:hypothetical protein